MTITSHKVDPRFKFEVASMAGGELVKGCFDCGTCTGVCPVSEVEPGFDPRKILHMIRLGLKEQVLSSTAIWFCTHCDTCALVCPQNVRFSSIVDVLRELAVKEGYAELKTKEPFATSPCKAACPAHISIPGFIAAVLQGKYREGLRLIKEEMPFPAICGRVCPHPCEAACNRNSSDKPVAIEYLKRFLADEDILSDESYIPQKKQSRTEKIGVVGSGPAGLTVAYYLSIEGYPVTVFEKLPVAGGMMAVGIPEFRLPRNILNAEIDIIKKLGVDIKLNFSIGKDCSLAELQKNYRAVFIGAGCCKSMKLGIAGEDVREDEDTGIIDGLMFLQDIHLGNLPASRGRLIVIGGGNTAVDCARVAIRLGYRNVAVLYRRTREEMPANSWEVDETIEEGIDIQFLTAPVRIISDDGKVSGVECVRMELGEPDESGRRRPVPVQGSEFIVKTNVIVSAIGQTPDLKCMTDKCEINISNRGLVAADLQTGLTNIPGIFAGGDVVSGPRTVVEAVAFGKRAALSIDKYLRGKDISSGRKMNWTGIKLISNEIIYKEREQMPRLPLAECTKSFKEIESGFNREQAKREAERCLKICGLQK
ncbi:MAG: hypothetical protein SRB1_01471 [Desulfobacteraceae bacterium Eth-SRB1]|nr:MAG: hypothetical protein SRB1_01471 [Desulfobacteraceae bacterium Eth-SRB1]